MNVEARREDLRRTRPWMVEALSEKTECYNTYVGGHPEVEVLLWIGGVVGCPSSGLYVSVLSDNSCKESEIQALLH